MIQIQQNQSKLAPTLTWLGGGLLILVKRCDSGNLI